jgi:hypothetical protein
MLNLPSTWGGPGGSSSGVAAAGHQHQPPSLELQLMFEVEFVRPQVGGGVSACWAKRNCTVLGDCVMHVACVAC